MSADELLDKAWKYRSLLGENPVEFSQRRRAAFCRSTFLIGIVLRKAKRKKESTQQSIQVEHLLQEKEPFFSKFEELMKYTDLLLLDIKHIDDEQHKILTGHTNQNILDLARYLSDINKPVWIRHVLVPERSDNDEISEKAGCIHSDTLQCRESGSTSYHTLGEYKWKELGMEYPLEGIEPPTEERIRNANELLHTGK